MNVFSMCRQTSLNPDFYFCEIDGEFLFLDINGDRYFALSSAQSDLFREILNAAPAVSMSPRATAYLKYLTTIGVLVDAPLNGKPLVPCPNPQVKDYPNRPLVPALSASMLLYFFQVLFAFITASRVFRSDCIKDAVHAATIWKKRSGSAKQASLERASRLANVCLAWSPLLFASRDQCLFRSLVTMRFLCRHKVPVELVFAVQRSPFSAHAWIEFEGHPLTEHPEIAEGFTRILQV